MPQSLFYKVFPTPAFLAMKPVGLDISDEAIRLASLAQGKTGKEIEFFAEKPLANGILSNGEIKNSDHLKVALTELRKEYSLSFACVSVPEEKAYIVRVRVPVADENEIRGNLELQLEEQVPIPVAEAVFDYDIVAKHADNFEVILSVLPRTVVDRYLSVFEGTGITPVSFQIESQAIARCVVPAGDQGTSMVVDIEQTKISMSIVSRGSVRFTSSTAMGARSLTEAIARALKISEEEAREMRKTIGISAKEEDQELFVAMVPILAVMRDEINQHFIYWHTHEDQYGNDRPRIEQLFLCGEGATIPGLADHFAVGLKAPVKLANIMVNVNPLERYIPDMEYNDSFKYATAIGLALG